MKFILLVFLLLFLLLLEGQSRIILWELSDVNVYLEYHNDTASSPLLKGARYSYRSVVYQGLIDPRSGERACNSAYACRDGEVLAVTKNRPSLSLKLAQPPSKMGQNL